MPTLTETPGLGGLVLESWMGLLAPAGTPRAMLERLATAVQKMSAGADLEHLLLERGIRPRVVQTAAFSALLRQEREQIAEVITKAGLKPE